MKKAGKRKPHWLEGDKRRIQIDALRSMLAEAGIHPREHELEKAEDGLRLQDLREAAGSPESVLEHGKSCVRFILENVVSAHRRLDPVYREKLRAFFIEERGLSAEQADSECDAIDVRGRPTLRCMRDAWEWLQKTQYALKNGRERINEGRTAKDKVARQFAYKRAEEEFARAVSLAYYAGVECGELKTRARFDEMHGSADNPKRVGQQGLGAIYDLAVAARSRWLVKHAHEKREPTDGEIYLEIERDTKEVRKRAGIFEFKGKSHAWKPLPLLKGFRNRMSEWRRKKYPGLG